MIEGFPEDQARRIGLHHAARTSLPPPTTLLDEGQEAYVFETRDRLVVVRVGLMGRLSKEPWLLDEEFRSGVVKVFGMEFDGDVVVTWKERLDTNVEGFLLRSLPRDQAAQMAMALVGLYRVDPSRMALLASWGPTQGLADAIYAGMPVHDLNIDCNLGVSRDGRIVAFDL